MALLSTLCASMMMTAAPACAGEVTSVEVSGSEVTVRFDDIIEGASSISLSGPNRIALDVRGASVGTGIDSAGGVVRSVRRGQFDNATTRIVLDLDRPAIVTDGSYGADGKSLRLSLLEMGDGTTRSAVRSSRRDFLPPAALRAAPPKQNYSVRVRLPEVKNAVDLPKVSGPDDVSRPLVVIDAGHGGHDPGAISPHGGKREKEITLALARKLRDELLATGRVRVALTRENDKFLVLEERFGIARRLKADLFISIHADAAGSPEANGATVYTLSEVASDREAARLAARENKANIINGVNLGGETSDVSSILIDLTQRETMNLSSNFAKLVVREGKDQVRFRSDPHKFASFVVLKAPDVPSILLESGYLTNETDVSFLSSEAGQQKLAGSVADAVTVYFARKLAAR